jgi:hypothetical protein
MLRALAALLTAGSMAACMVDKQEAPGLIGPAGTAQQLSLTASPDRIAHDGTAQSVITIAMRDDTGQPLANKRVSVGASIGSISHLDVVTGSDGRAAFIVTAPARSTPASDIDVFATPFGNDAEDALTRRVSIALTGSPVNKTAPTAGFTFLPEAPVEGDTIVFDASETTDEGQACASNCLYEWTFNTLGAGGGSGMILPRTGVTRGTYIVTLTVTDNAGTVATKTRSVTVAPPAAVTP